MLKQYSSTRRKSSLLPIISLLILHTISRQSTGSHSQSIYKDSYYKVQASYLMGGLYVRTYSCMSTATGDCSPRMVLRERPPQALLRVCRTSNHRQLWFTSSGISVVKRLLFLLLLVEAQLSILLVHGD